ncbi:hypothetical protein RS694_02515 [Rhodoferax saidenbachensis]|uniref:Lysine-specific metallo-endopeptidase domain-containing protein n=2 Tax=Rhodoferax saidenbachensis TaxID=1484693 RepID=A0A1P8K6A8_9BURK|nr:hypothetical protein RS694_02515 [Rhodoferax saidenbachensis]
MMKGERMTTLPEHVEKLPHYNADQKKAIVSQLGSFYAHDLRIKEGSTYTFLPFTEEQFTRRVWPTIGPQAVAKPKLLFIGFEAGELQMVNSIAAAFDDVNTMLDAGLQNVGVSGRFSATPYELLFGTKAMRSGSSFALRERKVKEVLEAIQTDLTKHWIIERKATSSDVASWSAGDKIAIGSAWPQGGGKFAAGVLIHEMGHRQGLQDICAVCRAADLKTAHFQLYESESLKCSKNKPHGDLAASNGGHFIGIKRSRLLATTQKNLTVWNADSYRWYCSYFFKPEVQAGAPKAISW